MPPVYLDHNATTPLDPRVADEIRRVSLEFPGNPESPHALGRAARARLEEARGRIAARLGAREREIVFTSGGTESGNLALRGAARARGDAPRRVVITAVEHPAVTAPARRLEEEGFEVVRLPVDGEGLPSPGDLAAALRGGARVVSVMLANNETGALLPVREMAEVARRAGVPFHTDAVQAAGKIPVDVRELGVDLLSAAGHKLNGPRGIGLLYVRDGTPLAPVLVGASQERGRRPGTSPVALAAGFALALELAAGELEERAAHCRRLVERLRAGLRRTFPGLRENGPPAARLPNTLNVTVEGVSGEALLLALDREGFCVATGSACATGAALPSHVLTAMGRTPEEVASSLRLSVGPTTTEEEVERFVEALPAVARRLRPRA